MCEDLRLSRTRVTVVLGRGQQGGVHSLIGEDGYNSSMIQQGEQQWFVLSISQRVSVSISADFTRYLHLKLSLHH